MQNSYYNVWTLVRIDVCVEDFCMKLWFITRWYFDISYVDKMVNSTEVTQYRNKELVKILKKKTHSE